MREFPERTLSRNTVILMHSDRANRNGVQGKSASAGYNRLPQVFSSPPSMVSIRSQKGVVLVIGFLVFLCYLWMFSRQE